MMNTWILNENYKMELEEICSLPFPYNALENKKILITGANGLIASYLIDLLIELNTSLDLNLHITALVRSKEKALHRFADYLDQAGFELLIGDVCQKEMYINQNWDYIVHAAGNAHPRAYATQPVETMKANLLGIINILDYAVRQEVKNGVEKIVFLSSGEVYGNAEKKSENGWTEDTQGVLDSMMLRSCYPESKRAAETLCQSYYQEYNIPVVVARLSYIYGATIQSESTRADAQFLRNALAGEDIVMKSEGKQIRSYCYLQDAAIAILLLLLEGKAGEAYNVANPNSIASIREYAECLAKTFGVNVKMELPDEIEQSGYSKMQREILDSTKLRELGWKPRYTLEKGMEQMKRVLI